MLCSSRQARLSSTRLESQTCSKQHLPKSQQTLTPLIILQLFKVFSELLWTSVLVLINAVAAGPVGVVFRCTATDCQRLENLVWVNCVLLLYQPCCYRSRKSEKFVLSTRDLLAEWIFVLAEMALLLCFCLPEGVCATAAAAAILWAKGHLQQRETQQSTDFSLCFRSQYYSKLQAREQALDIFRDDLACSSVACSCFISQFSVPSSPPLLGQSVKCCSTLFMWSY